MRPVGLKYYATVCLECGAPVHFNYGEEKFIFTCYPICMPRISKQIQIDYLGEEKEELS